MTSSSGNTDLVETTDNTLTIPTLASGSYTSPSDFPANHWGYKKDSGSYIPFATNTTILESDTYANDDTTTLSFATKIDYLQASGTYKTTLVFTTTANPLVDYIQNLNPTLCTATPLTVIDKRDGEEYTVQRLADGNCWLLDNLRLDISDPAVQAKLNSTTTNATDTVLGYLRNGGGTSPYPANGVIAKTASGGSWADSYNAPYIATAYKDTIQAALSPAPAGKIGIYYNYCAASAGSYCYAADASSGDASQDICPAGWHLPTGGASGQYQTLYTAYSSNVANFESALSTPLSGYFASGTAYDQGTLGRFWSSSRYDGYYMHSLRVDPPAVTPQNYNGRAVGLPVRCILNDTRTISNITYMQDMNSQIVANTPANATATMRDRRDDQDYTVGKLADGKIWMTSNLRLGLDESNPNTTTLELTPDDSNVTQNRTITAYDLVTYGTSGKSCYGDSSGSGSGYTTPCIHSKDTTSGNNTIGVWYNYAAATVGTITGSSNTTETTEDICPRGWKMPSSANNTALVSTIGNSPASFNPVYGGYYYNVLYDATTYGGDWSTTAYNNQYRYTLTYSSNKLGTSYGYRYGGRYIRCIAK